MKCLGPSILNYLSIYQLNIDKIFKKLQKFKIPSENRVRKFEGFRGKPIQNTFGIVDVYVCVRKYFYYVKFILSISCRNDRNSRFSAGHLIAS